MCTRAKTARKIREACIAAGLAFCLGLAHAAGDLRIQITADVVAIKADDTSTRSVLEELSRQTDLVVMSQEALDDLVSIDIEEPTLPQAIRRLLRHRSFVLQQSSGDAGRLWILSEHEDNGGHLWATRASRKQNIGGELTDYLVLATSGDAGDREEAMYGFGDSGKSDSIEFLRLGLSDPDENVREEAIRSLAELGGAEAVLALGVAAENPDPRVRVDAIDALGDIGGQEVMTLLQRATADDNATVRQAAAEVLTELAWNHNL